MTDRTLPDASAASAASAASELSDDLQTLNQDADLETVLIAWNAATVRLEKTHETLRSEVERLRDDLEVKNQELARKNRLADLGRMASHIAHEVRNDLVPVTLYLSLMRRRLSEDSGSLDILGKIEAGFTALDVTVNDLLNFTSHRDPQWVRFNAYQLVSDIVVSLAPQIAAQGIETVIDVPFDVEMTADRDMMRRSLINLMLNALDAMPDGGDLVITSYQGLGGVELEVADSGEGLSNDSIDRVFEPFFTTKSNGTGLGLAIVDRVAEAHGGEVSVRNCPEGGAAFTIRIPQRVMKAAA